MKNIKLITKIFRDRETLKSYQTISVQHSELYDGKWNYPTNEYIYYEDKWTKEEYLKLTNNE